MEIRDDVLADLHDMILKASDSKGYLLSRAAIVPDHVHLTLGCPLEQSPEQIVLGFMNNLAYACGMKPVFRFSYYLGAFSEYDLGVIPRA
jgi:REP element-mobilizing transposase RayT